MGSEIYINSNRYIFPSLYVANKRIVHNILTTPFHNIPTAPGAILLDRLQNVGMLWIHHADGVLEKQR